MNLWVVFGYLAAINVLAFAVYGLDKRRAVKGGRRIRVVTLLGLAFIGGSAGALIAMHVFRHKTRKVSFTVGVPLMMALQLVLLFLVMNAK